MHFGLTPPKNKCSRYSCMYGIGTINSAIRLKQSVQSNRYWPLRVFSLSTIHDTAPIFTKNLTFSKDFGLPRQKKTEWCHKWSFTSNTVRSVPASHSRYLSKWRRNGLVSYLLAIKARILLLLVAMTPWPMIEAYWVTHFSSEKFLLCDFSRPQHRNWQFASIFPEGGLRG